MSGPFGSSHFFSTGAPYTVAQSILFVAASSQDFTKTFSGASDDPKKFTFSCWFKRISTTAASLVMFGAGETGNKFDNLSIDSQFIRFSRYGGSSYTWQIETTATFEDYSKWYHLVAVYDSAQATTADRITIYIDGTEITDFRTSSYPSLNLASAYYLQAQINAVGAYYTGSFGAFFDGKLAECCAIDGQALTASSFGETIGGTWSPKDLSGLTPGTNGYLIQDASGVDAFGNNDFTPVNTPTNSTDVPP